MGFQVRQKKKMIKAETVVNLWSADTLKELVSFCDKVALKSKLGNCVNISGKQQAEGTAMEQTISLSKACSKEVIFCCCCCYC